MIRLSQLWNQIEIWCIGNEEDDDEVEDNDKDHDNNKEDNDDKSISAQGLDRDLGFS